MALTYDGTNGITFNDGSKLGSASSLGMRNRIINGAMMVDQRNAGANTVVTAGDSVWNVDRWMGSCSQSNKFTLQQSSTAPVGFKNSMVATVTNPITVAAGDYAGFLQRVEGSNLYDLGWGAVGASTITVSFWVRSSVTGTYGVSIRNNGDTRSYVSTYTINSANTWEYKTITIPGDVTGTWLTSTGLGLAIYFTLSSGATYGSATNNTWSSSLGIATSSQTQWIQTNAATFYVTGVQLEKGSVATPFEYRPYGTELALCQRYFWKKVGGASGSSYEPIGNGYVYNTTTNARVNVQYPSPMRAIPTFSTNGTLYMGIGTGNLTPSTITSYAGLNSALIDVTVSSSTIGFTAMYYTSNTIADYFQASAEL